MTSRRTFIRNTAGWAGFAALQARAVTRASAAPIFVNDPFQLGVASGDPAPDGFVIWTRLVPDILNPESLPPNAIPVAWEIAADEGFRKIVRRGETHAPPALAHSVHVEVHGLEPARPYFYRFHCGAAVSRTGRAKTRPRVGAALDRLKFAFASCQRYDAGFFTAYRDVIDQDPDFILHLGDYVYETASGATVRPAPVKEARSLDDYRLLHAVYKTDPDLQAAHALFSWLFLWDDHEVANDYSRDESERDRDPDIFHARRRAAYQAYYEHMPLRAAAAPMVDGGVNLYQRLQFGHLVDMAITDQRQYRDPIACQPVDWHAGRIVELTQCPGIDNPARSMWGRKQEEWLGATWAQSGARWNLLAQSLKLASLDQLPGPVRGGFTDNWDGYPVARRKALELVAARRKAGADNFVSIGGDIHAYVMSDLRLNDFDMTEAPLMSEFVGTSITSESHNTEVYRQVLPENPHIKLIDDTVRGYVLCDVTPQTWTTTLRMVDDVRVRTPHFRTRAKFALESGRPGLQTA